MGKNIKTCYEVERLYEFHAKAIQTDHRLHTMCGIAEHKEWQYPENNPIGQYAASDYSRLNYIKSTHQKNVILIQKTQKDSSIFELYEVFPAFFAANLQIAPFCGLKLRKRIFISQNKNQRLFADSISSQNFGFS